MVYWGGVKVDRYALDGIRGILGMDCRRQVGKYAVRRNDTAIRR